MSTGRRTALAGEGPSSSVPAPRHRLTVVPLAARSQHLHRALERPHGHLPLRLLSRGTSLETAEKHYGDARVDAVHLDELIREFELPTRNPPGTLPVASDDALPSKTKEPFVFYGVPTRAGDRGRTGDVQLGKLPWPLWCMGFSAAVAETG